MRLALGTVKFGMPWYGRGSTSRPTVGDSLEAITAARTLGIDCFDTAAGYGDAEVLLDAAGVPRDRVITKTRPALYDAGKATRRDFRAVLLHNPSEAFLGRLGDLSEVVDGASVYTVAEGDAAVRAGLRMLQVPVSVLDQRFVPYLADWDKAGVQLFCRAPYLQGVLARARDGVESAWFPGPVRRYLQCCCDAGSHPAATALRFALTVIPPSARVVFGASSAEQVAFAVEQAALSPLSADIVEALTAAFRETPDEVRIPSLWPQ